MLNQIVKLTLGATLAFVLIGCGGDSGEYPRDVAIAFAKKGANGDINGVLEMFKPAMTDKLMEQSRRTKESGGVKNIEVISENIQGQEAKVKVRVNFKDDSSKTDTVPLKNVDGKWGFVFSF